jgi:hypothetical protein
MSKKELKNSPPKRIFRALASKIDNQQKGPINSFLKQIEATFQFYTLKTK